MQINILVNIIFYLNETIYQAALNSRDFVIYTNEGILTKPVPLEIKENPLISVIIPMFNAENFINRAILSIQNQNYSNFEIVIVNDFSSDNSLNIVKQSSKNDKRIKIINNTKKMGNLYSRCIGTIMSKGKYIFPLDSDDMMIASDSLYVIQKEAEQYKLDIIRYKGISVYNISDFINIRNLSQFRSHRTNRIIFQPSIAKYTFRHCSLQAQCINSDLYKMSINSYGKERWSYYMNNYEDCIMHHIIYHLAKSCEFFLKIGYLNIKRNSSTSNIEPRRNRMKNRLFYIEAIYEFSNFSFQDKENATEFLIELLKSNNFKFIFKDDKIKNCTNNLIKKIIFDKSISHKNKILLKNEFSNFIKGINFD